MLSLCSQSFSKLSSLKGGTIQRARLDAVMLALTQLPSHILLPCRWVFRFSNISPPRPALHPKDQQVGREKVKLGFHLKPSQFSVRARGSNRSLTQSFRTTFSFSFLRFYESPLLCPVVLLRSRNISPVLKVLDCCDGRTMKANTRAPSLPFVVAMSSYEQ